MRIHGGPVTHMDTPAHFFRQGKMYNGRPAHLISTNLDATAESIELAKDGIVTKAVLVDAPMIRGMDWLERGEGVMPDDILAAEEHCGFRVDEGDVKEPINFQQVGGTACQAACLPLFYERGIAMKRTDATNDVIPSGYPSLTNPIHQVGLVAMGLWIPDRANLEDPSQKCSELNR